MRLIRIHVESHLRVESGDKLSAQVATSDLHRIALYIRRRWWVVWSPLYDVARDESRGTIPTA